MKTKTAFIPIVVPESNYCTRKGQGFTCPYLTVYSSNDSHCDLKSAHGGFVPITTEDGFRKPEVCRELRDYTFKISKGE